MKTQTHLAVEITVNHERILCLSSNSLSGIGNIEAYAEEIRECAQMLLGFIGKKDPEPFFDPYSTPEYAAFVEEMAKHCQCLPPHSCPCDGVLAGGLCDKAGWSDWSDPQDDSWRDEEDEL
jgi:hypothetical protein